jgi:hypothetical protein
MMGKVNAGAWICSVGEAPEDDDAGFSSHGDNNDSRYVVHSPFLRILGTGVGASIEHSYFTTEKETASSLGLLRGDDAMLYALGGSGLQTDASTSRDGEHEGNSARISPMPTHCASINCLHNLFPTSDLLQMCCNWAASIGSLQHSASFATLAFLGTPIRSSLRNNV